MITSGNRVKMNQEFISCFVKPGIRAPWQKSSVCPKGALHLGLTMSIERKKKSENVSGCGTASSIEIHFYEIMVSRDNDMCCSELLW